MGTTADKLNHLTNTKEGIRQEINRAYNTEEISTSDTFNSYIQKLEEHPFYIMRYIERSIESIRLFNATSVGNYAFNSCSNLAEVSFPNATSIGDRAFDSCSKLTEVSFPNATSIGNYAFRSCSKLTEVSFPNATSIGNYAFQDCSSLITIYVGINTSTVCTLGSYAFTDCNNLTNIYVPANLVDSYKSATNWSTYADKIKAAPQEGGGEVTNKSITVTTSGIADYGWIPATSEYNVEGYDVYMSRNSENDSNAVMKIECVGYTELTIYIMTYFGEGNLYCTMASTVNASTYPTSYDSSYTKAIGNSTHGTTLSDYTAVNYTGLKDNDVIYIVHTRKHSMFAPDPNTRGFVLIPKQS